MTPERLKEVPSNRVGIKEESPSLVEQVRDLYQGDQGNPPLLQKELGEILKISPHRVRTLLRKLEIPPHPKSVVSRRVAQNPKTKERLRRSLRAYWRNHKLERRQRSLVLWRNDTYRKTVENSLKAGITEKSRAVEEKIREKYFSCTPSALRILTPQEAEILGELYASSPVPLRNSEVVERKKLTQKRVANLKTRALTKLGIFRRDGKYNEVVDFADLILGVEKGRIVRTVLKQPNYPTENTREVKRIGTALATTEMIRGYVRLPTVLQSHSAEEDLQTLTQAKKDHDDLFKFSWRFLFLVAIPHNHHYQDYKEGQKEELERAIFEAIRDFGPGGTNEDFGQFLIQRAKTTFPWLRSQPKPGEPLTAPV